MAAFLTGALVGAWACLVGVALAMRASVRGSR
jgi:hypothetical protein